MLVSRNIFHVVSALQSIFFHNQRLRSCHSRGKGLNVKVSKQNLFIDNQALDIYSIPSEYQSAVE